MKRRDVIKGAASLAAAGALPLPAIAQGAWPAKDKPVKVIVPWPPGAANDALGRLVADRIAQKFGVTTVTENRVGGAGLVGTKAVVAADPDGNTLLASAFNTAVMPIVLKSAADFNPEVDLEMVARTAVAPLVCVMSASRAPEDTRRSRLLRPRPSRRNGTSPYPRSAPPGISRRSNSCVAPAPTSPWCHIAARSPRCRISWVDRCSC